VRGRRQLAARSREHGQEAARGLIMGTRSRVGPSHERAGCAGQAWFGRLVGLVGLGGGPLIHYPR
jgi:hypothetical protein